jgi:hypothetical protein
LKVGKFLPGTATDKDSFGSRLLDLGGGRSLDMGGLIFDNKININYKNVID